MSDINYPELAEAQANWRFQPGADCLKDQVILVTGAGDGIGRATAKTFAAYGADVVLLGRTRQKLESVFDWIKAETDTSPVIVPFDLLTLDDESANALLSAISDNYERLDGIVHNASLLGPKVPIGHYPSQQWKEVMHVNAFAPFLLTRTMLPLLSEAERAALLFVSSSVGHQGRAYWGAYAASKFAQEGLMETLADEVAETTNIVVASANPGGTRTSMRAQAYPAENPASVPVPETHMDFYLYLFGSHPKALHGAKVHLREWKMPAE